MRSRTERSLWIMSSIYRIGSSNIASRSSLLKLGKWSRSTALCCSKRRKSSQLPPNSVASPRARSSFIIRRACAIRTSGLCKSPAAACASNPSSGRSEIEPVATEFGRQPARALVFHHPAGLRDQDVRPLQIARRRVRQQLLVGHAGPKEITEPAGESVPGERTHGWRGGGLHGNGSNRGRSCSSAPICAGVQQIDAVAEVGRHQHADDRVANGLFMRQPALLPKRVVIRQHVVAFRLRQRSAVCARRKTENGIEMLRLGIHPLLFQSPESIAKRVGTES